MARNYTIVRSNWNNMESKHDEIVVPNMTRDEIKHVGDTDFFIISRGAESGIEEQHVFVLDNVEWWSFTAEARD